MTPDLKYNIYASKFKETDDDNNMLVSINNIDCSSIEYVIIIICFIIKIRIFVILRRIF